MDEQQLAKLTETIARGMEIGIERAFDKQNKNSQLITGQMDQAASPKGEPYAVDDKRVRDMTDKAFEVILSNSASEDEQFAALTGLRQRMSQYWDEQAHSSEELSQYNSRRSATLGKFISMTAPK